MTVTLTNPDRDRELRTPSIMESVLLLLLMLAASAEETYQRGVQAFSRGARDEAVRLFTEATAMNARHALAWKALGVAHAAGGDHELAAEPFQRACSLQPSLEDACFYYARNLYARNLFEPSLAALEKAASIDSKPWRIAHARGQALEALGRTGEAEKEYLTAIKQSDAVAVRVEDEPRLSYGVFLYRQGKNDTALPWLEHAVRRHASSAKAHFELGRALYQSGRLEDASVRLREAVRLDPLHNAARLLLDKVTRLNRK